MTILSMNINQIFSYIYIKWKWDTIRIGIDKPQEEILVLAIIWNGLITFIIILLTWYYIGLPKRLIKKGDVES